MKLRAMLLALCLTACAQQATKPMTVHERIETACVSAGAAYEVIAKVNNVHPLKKDQQEKVLAAVAITDKPCKLAPGADYPYTMTELALRELEDAAATLKSIKGSVQ